MKLKNKIILFAISFMIVHTLLYLLFVLLMNKNNELVKNFNNYKNIKALKTLILGDSHVARSIDESKLDSTVSLAYFGENNKMNYYKLNYCLNNRYAKPQYVVLPCDIVTYTEGYHYYRTNKNFYYSIIPFQEVKNLNKNKLIAYYDYLKIKLIPYSEWQYALNRMNVNRQKKSTQNFSNISKNEQERDAAHFIQDELLIGGNKANFYSESALIYLNKTIKLCKDNGIKLIFVKFPLTQTLFNEIKFNVDSTFINYRPAETIITQNAIPILNFEYLYLNNPELFFDSHHLNMNGKNEFTSVLKQKLDSLYKVY